MGKNAPKIDKDPDDVVCAFIDKHITARIPPIAPENKHHINLMVNLQKHTHSDYCCRNKSCHFGMYITSLHKTSYKDFLQEINLDIETYMNALKISQREPNVILRQNPQDVLINACNHDILSLWRGNVDLQYVINEIATVKYVCSYMTKGEKGMGETLKRVAKECQNDAIRTQMNKIKKEFLGKQVLGAPETAM